MISYVVSVRGPTPADLDRRMAQAHAEAVRAVKEGRTGRAN
jgi:hypothetical protein